MQVTRDDICVPGMEDLRSQNEVLVAIPVMPDLTADEIADRARIEIEATSQSEYIDSDKVFDTVLAYYEGTAIDVNCVNAHNQATSEAEEYGYDPEDIEDWPTLFIYIEI